MPDVPLNTTNKSIYVRVADAGTGLPVENLVASNITFSYQIGNNAPNNLALSDLGSITASFTVGGIKHIADGKYRIDVPNTCWQTLSETVKFFAEATDCIFYFYDYWIVPPYINGIGKIAVTLLIEAGSDPVEDVRVWVSTDSNGTNIVAGSAYTNEFGQVTFYLNAGTYYRFASKTGYSFTNPQSFVVT